MNIKQTESNPILDAALTYQYPEYSEERGIEKIVAFGEHSHRCPIYVRQTPPCTAGCPAGNDIRFWLTTVRHARRRKLSWEESYELAWHEASKTTPFPAICGRVCPHPCETGCNRGRKDDGAVNINAFERFVGDYGIAHGLQHKKLTTEVMAKKVAVIGAGPAGLSCAFQLARRGYPVTVFEAFSKPGGMLRYENPPYRLPRQILDAEIDAIVKMGVEIRCNTIIGKDKRLDDLQADFDAIFIGIAAHEGIQLGVTGEDASNVFSADKFLKMINTDEPVPVGARVVVVGGGDSALIVARVARRLGAEVTILYRRTNVEMPANESEIREAVAEKINIRYLVAPMGIRTEDGKAVAVQCRRTELGDPDENGRPRPIPVEGSQFEVPCTALILAIGQRPAGKDTEQYTIGLKPDTNWSVDENIYVGGGYVGPAKVTTAIGQGRMVAEQMAAQLEGKRFHPPDEPEIIPPENIRLNFYMAMERNERSWLPVEERLQDGLDREIDLGITEEQFRAEAKRCMSCGLCFECRQCLIFCPQTAISAFPENPIGEVMYTDYNKCVGCHICAQACPCGYIRMGTAGEL